MLLHLPGVKASLLDGISIQLMIKSEKLTPSAQIMGQKGAECHKITTRVPDVLQLRNYALRSSGKYLLLVPKVKCSTLGDRAFAHAAPVLWNSLPLTIRSSSSLAIFKKQLKTFLFKKAFNLLE